MTPSRVARLALTQSPRVPDLDLLHLRRETPEELIYRFGNLTLLEKKFNIAGSNKPLDVKREKAYDHSALPTNEDLKSNASDAYQTFGPAEVLRREKEFAERAEQIWRV